MLILLNNPDIILKREYKNINICEKSISFLKYQFINMNLSNNFHMTIMIPNSSD